MDTTAYYTGMHAKKRTDLNTVKCFYNKVLDKNNNNNNKTPPSPPKKKKEKKRRKKDIHTARQVKTDRRIDVVLAISNRYKKHHKD